MSITKTIERITKSEPDGKIKTVAAGWEQFLDYLEKRLFADIRFVSVIARAEAKCDIPAILANQRFDSWETSEEDVFVRFRHYDSRDDYTKAFNLFLEWEGLSRYRL